VSRKITAGIEHAFGDRPMGVYRSLDRERVRTGNHELRVQTVFGPSTAINSTNQLIFLGNILLRIT
jgi:hypothetical protein